jgi:predicted metal-dependent HD superfamily phosphohydrolase
LCRPAAERRRREEAAAAAGERRLNGLARNPVLAWNQVDELISTKRPKDYDAAVVLLRDLQALAARQGEIFEFAEQMTRLRERHARKPSLIDRFDRARLD